MKANAPKRKIFDDAVDVLCGADISASGTGIKMLPIDSIHPFRKHPFRLYGGNGWMIWWTASESMVFKVR